MLHKDLYTNLPNLEVPGNDTLMNSFPFLASDAADVMGFESNEELEDAVKRAMELCRFAGIPTSENFRRIAIKDHINSLNFESKEDLYSKVKRAMELCSIAGIPTKENIKHFYKSSSNNIKYDWKLSLKAYRLVCISGKATNPNVARLIVQLLSK